MATQASRRSSKPQCAAGPTACIRLKRRARFSLLISLPFLLALQASPLKAVAEEAPAGVVRSFGPNLGAACPRPEGLAIDRAGNLYVASVQPAPVGVLCVVNSVGRIADRIHVTPGRGATTVALTGMLFNPQRGLYALDVGDFLAGRGASQNGRLLRIDPRTHTVTVIAGGFAFPNGIAQDQARNIYVSDSARGAIYRVTPRGVKSVWSQDSRISRHVNDLAFDEEHHFLYVVTTGSIVRIPLQEEGRAGAPQVFADSSTSDAPNFADGLLSDDGIAVDEKGDVFFTAAATSEIFELSREGKLISRYSGLGPNILDEPSALVFKDDNLYISNTSQADGGLHAGLSVLRVTPQTRSIPGFLIHGLVTDASTQQGIQGIKVNAVEPSINCCPFHNLSFTQADSTGHYELLVPAGSTVKIHFDTFDPKALPYVGQWWNNKVDFEAADALTPNAETFNVDAALLRGALVHGRATDAANGAGIAGIDVQAVDPGVNCCPFRNLGFGQTDANGDYQLLVPQGSRDKLQFFAFPTGTPPYVAQWWKSSPFFEGADVLVVTAETFGINVAMQRGVFIHGHVTDAASHAGIPGISIGAIDSTVPCCPFHNLAFAQSNSTGAYDLFVPLGRSVKIQFGSFGPNPLPYLQQWWNNKPDFDSADALSVAAETFNIDAALIHGFFVHGQVTDAASHAAIAGINVDAVDPAVNCCPFRNLAFSQTDSNGNYEILVAPGSRIKLQFSSFGPNAPPYLQQWWNNKPDFANADTLTVNQETFGINVALVRGVVIHGLVTDAVTHRGITGIGVGAVDPTVQCCPFRNINNTATDAGGNYALTVPSGVPFRLNFFQFPVTSPAYLGQWWNNKPDFSSADTLTVTQDSFGIDAALTPAFLIQGRVTDQATGNPLAGMNVNAIDPSGRFVSGSSTDPNGNYSMAVAAGSYKVRFASDPTSSSLPYPAQWWNGKPDFASADVLAVAADRVGVDAAVTLGVFVHGRVTDASTGAGVGGIDVDASDSTLPCCSSEAFAQTDAAGDYRLAVRIGATVRIHFFAFPSGSPPYIEVWWRNSRFFETADTLTVTSETFGIDAALAPGVFIHGNVTDAVSHSGIAGINIDVVQPDVACCPFGDLGAAQTDVNGNFTVLVPKGTPFKIQFLSSPGNPHYVEQWWNNKPTFQTADTLTVQVETSGIDAALAPG